MKTNNMKTNKKKASPLRRRPRLFLATGILVSTLGAQTATGAEDWLTKDWEVSGYLREYLSWNLENPTLIGPDGQQRDDVPR